MLEYCVATSRINGCVRGWTNFVSYSFRTSLCMTDVSLDCCEKFDCNANSWADKSVAKMRVVTTVVLGRGFDVEVGRNSLYTRTWPGLNKQNILRHSGVGSHTASSQTSLVASGWALDSALSGASIVERKRRGEEETGDESTRTR